MNSITTYNLTSSSSSSLSSLFSTLPLWLIHGSDSKDKNIICESVSITSPDGKKQLIKNSGIQFILGRKYGLIGLNGSGKTTLLNEISEYKLTGFPNYLKVVYLKQAEILENSKTSIIEFLVDSDDERCYLEQEKKRL